MGKKIALLQKSATNFERVYIAKQHMLAYYKAIINEVFHIVNQLFQCEIIGFYVNAM